MVNWGWFNLPQNHDPLVRFILNSPVHSMINGRLILSTYRKEKWKETFSSGSIRKAAQRASFGWLSPAQEMVTQPIAGIDNQHMLSRNGLKPLQKLSMPRRSDCSPPTRLPTALPRIGLNPSIDLRAKCDVEDPGRLVDETKKAGG